MTTQELTTNIETAIQSVINGSASQYINFTDENETLWKFRVSNHMANPLRTDANTISLVIELPEQDEEYSNWSIAKKSFKNITNQFYLNE
ncbi:MAG TPA: hypothetical protein PLU10_11450, partial [Chitinophagaceae bacterium]|nr:hypothetical protein [Chitinophagaceae bacterium]